MIESFGFVDAFGSVNENLLELAIDAETGGIGFDALQEISVFVAHG